MIVSFHLKSDWPLRVLLPEAATWGDLWKSFFENSAEFNGKHLGQSLFFQKVAGWAHNLIKKRDSSTWVFVLIHNTSWRLLLELQSFQISIWIVLKDTAAAFSALVAKEKLSD